MIAVIQCAAGKRPDAGLMIDTAGRKVLFVAHPELMPTTDHVVFAHPDAISDDGSTWRERLLAYNRDPQENPLGLLPAIDLYAHDAYRKLAAHLEEENTYILSAGWGLVRSDFLLPAYDITFSGAAESHKRRRQAERFDDFRHLQADQDEEIVFFGGKDYLPLFLSLTDGHARRKVFFNSVVEPMPTEGVEFVRYRTTARTNWHYQCIADFVSGNVNRRSLIA